MNSCDYMIKSSSIIDKLNNYQEGQDPAFDQQVAEMYFDPTKEEHHLQKGHDNSFVASSAAALF